MRRESFMRCGLVHEKDNIAAQGSMCGVTTAPGLQFLLALYAALALLRFAEMELVAERVQEVQSWRAPKCFGDAWAHSRDSSFR